MATPALWTFTFDVSGKSSVAAVIASRRWSESATGLSVVLSARRRLQDNFDDTGAGSDSGGDRRGVATRRGRFRRASLGHGCRPNHRHRGLDRAGHAGRFALTPLKT